MAAFSRFATSPMRASGRTAVVTGVRPGGFSVRRLTSSSPYWVSSNVRGIGVADMVSRCTAPSRGSPLACRRWRSFTPKRCCSSITANASRSKRTASWNRAWVPIATRASPLASAASRSRRSPAVSRPVSSTAVTPASENIGASR